jgi:energy-coupling factor transporter transmembrane protein EcfT
VNPVLLTFALLLIAILVQLIVWRVKLPKNQTVSILYIFLCIFILGEFYFISTYRDILAAFSIALAYVPMSLAYVCLYTAIECDSPTLTLIKFISSRGRTGAKLKELEHLCTNRPFLLSRINILIASRVVKQVDESLILDREIPPLIKLVLLFNKFSGKTGNG